MGKEVDRRKYLQIAGAAVGGAVIGAAAGWYGAPAKVLEKIITETVEKTVTIPATLSPTGPTYLVKEYSIAVSKEGFNPFRLEVYNPNPPEPFIVKLTITSKDTAHIFAIDEFDVKETIEAGQTVTIQFVVEKGVRGKFRFYCPIHGEEGELIIAFGGG